MAAWGMLAFLLFAQSVTAAPPPMPVSDCFPPGPFVVFFPRDQATVTPETQAILSNLVRAEADPCGPFRFSITGHVDRGERAGLDRRRASAVRELLAGRGLRRLIGPVHGVRSTVPRVAHADRSFERQNARVVIETLPTGD